MNKWVIAAVIAVVVLAKVNTEYEGFKASLADAKQKALESLTVADEAKKTLSTLTQTIQDLRARLLRSEMELSAMQQVAKVETPKDCVCGPNCQCNAGGTPCQCPKVEVGPIGPKVTMHSRAGCEACDKWKRDSMPDWKSKGWAVEVLEDTDEEKTYPWFEICEGGKCYKVTGPLTAESYLKAKK